MIRVLHYGLDSRLGGIETYLNKLYNNIDKNKFKFDFLTHTDKEPCWYKEFTEMGSKFYNITPRSKNPIKNRRELSQLFENEKFDVIHCHLNTLSYILPIKIALKKNIPVIVHSRNAGASKSILSNLLHRINFFILPRKKIKMISVSDLAGKWLFGANTNYEVINNGLNIDKYTFNIEARKNIRNELGIRDELVIAHLGAMREQKNHMFILDIFKEVLKYKTDCKLLLVGDGELRKQITDKINELSIEKSVIITGNRNDVPDILSAADKFIFPSFFEGFPNAVLEAETTGLSCLVSDRITKEVIINNNCKCLSLECSSNEWARALLDLEANMDRKLYAKNIEKNGFSVEDEVKKIQLIYENMYLK